MFNSLTLVHDCQTIYTLITSPLTEKPFHLLRPQSFSFQIVSEFIEIFIKFSNFMSWGRGFLHNDCPEGRVFASFESCHWVCPRGKVFTPFESCPRVCPGGMVLDETDTLHYKVQLIQHAKSCDIA